MTLQELAEALEADSRTCANPVCDRELTELGETYCTQQCETEHNEWAEELRAFYDDDHATELWELGESA